MGDISLDELADRIRPYVRQCPQDTITQALIDVMRDWCQWTRCYQVEDNDTVQALVSDYDLSLPSSSVEQIAVEEMSVDQSPCYPKDPRWLAQNVAADWRTRKADDFRFFTQLKPGTFSFPCVPTKMGTINGIFYRISLRPTLAASVVDSEQSNRWLDAWSAGVLAKLKSIGGNPAPAWHDPEGAKMKGFEYHSTRGWARIEVSKGYTNALQTFGNRKRRFA